MDCPHHLGQPVTGLKPISNYSKITFLICLTGIAMGIAIYFFPIENQLSLKSEISDPILANENFNHDARRIGGKAFPVPKIEADQITREPSINSTNFKTERQNKRVPVFSMPRPIVQDITTIISGGKTVKIAGIAPLPANSQCTVDEKVKPCGKMARTALRALIRGRTLTCRIPKSNLENDAITTSCKIGNIDIANWLVKHGWTKSIENN